MNTDEHESGSGACEGNAAPYVLGALEEDERAAFRRHLESCAVCREEVASLRAVASSLAAVAPAATAPPELKRRVMSTVRSEAREPELRARPRVGQRQRSVAIIDADLPGALDDVVDVYQRRVGLAVAVNPVIGVVG